MYIRAYTRTCMTCKYLRYKNDVDPWPNRVFNTWDFLINCFRFASSKTLVFRSSSLSNSRRSVFLSDDDFLSFRLASFSFLCFFFFSFFSFFSFFWKYKNTQHYFPFGWHNLRWPETKRRPKILKHNKIFAYTHFVILLYLHVRAYMYLLHVYASFC